MEHGNYKNKGGRPPGLHIRGEHVRTLRRRRGMTQDQLARAAQISRRTVNAVERSQRVARGTLRAVASCLGVDLASIVLTGPDAMAAG